MVEDLEFKSINSGIRRFNTILRSHPGGYWDATAQKIDARQQKQRIDRILKSKTVNTKALGWLLAMAAALLFFFCIFQQQEN